ncbi:outer membrane family protein [Helicobacter felistomachi]|uniref:outer membrane family protein n=1 Tax=Helicobacter felistomachi TaxID=3040201 RepID=UPI0025728FAA|nr:outer membrane family protein [Helicobacter sp. NHP21005]
MLKRLLAALFGTFNCVHALDYKISGLGGSFSRIGFNNSPINTAKGIYPTGSYVTLVASLQLGVNLLPKSVSNHKLKAAIGAELGDLAYDSTQTLTDTSGLEKGFLPANYYYMGRWEGYFMDAPWKHSRYETDMHTRDFVLHTLYLDYSYKDHFGFKLGRYRSRALFLSGYNQGIQLFLHFGDWSLQWFSSYGRARSNIQYIRDFYAPISYKFSDGQHINYGLHSLSFVYRHDYKYNHITVMPFVWFYPKLYTAPGLQLDFKLARVNWRVHTHFYAWFPIYDSYMAHRYFRSALVGTDTASLLVYQHFDIANHYNFGWGVYKNFGNASACIGWTGLPVPFGTKDNTPYAKAYSNLYNANSLTAFAYVGFKVQNFSWQLLGKIIQSPRANSKSLMLTLRYDLSKHIHLMFKINGYEVTIHRGYKVGYFSGGYNPKFQANTQDRSYVMTSMGYDF